MLLQLHVQCSSTALRDEHYVIFALHWVCFPPFVCLAAHVSECPGGLTETFNCRCHALKAGGSLVRLGYRFGTGSR
jgi:hypothetical protein